jgi:hypothetical protein
MENGGEYDTNNDKPAPSFADLEVWRKREFEPTEHWYINERSVGDSANAVDNIVAWVKRKPEKLPEVIERLIDNGEYFESLKDVVPMDKDGWIDGKLSSDAVTEIVLKIGPVALPFLEKSEEKYAKGLAKALQGKINADHRRDLLARIGLQIKKVLP